MIDNRQEQFYYQYSSPMYLDQYAIVSTSDCQDLCVYCNKSITDDVWIMIWQSEEQDMTMKCCKCNSLYHTQCVRKNHQMISEVITFT